MGFLSRKQSGLTLAAKNYLCSKHSGILLGSKSIDLNKRDNSGVLSKSSFHREEERKWICNYDKIKTHSSNL